MLCLCPCLSCLITSWNLQIAGTALLNPELQGLGLWFPAGPISCLTHTRTPSLLTQSIFLSNKSVCGGRIPAKGGGCQKFSVVLFTAVPWKRCVEVIGFQNTTGVLGRRKLRHAPLLECQQASWLSSREIPLLLWYRKGGCLLQLPMTAWENHPSSD